MTLLTNFWRFDENTSINVEVAHTNFKLVLGSIDSVAPFINVNKQSESNPDCSFHSSIEYFASGRSYHQNLFISTVAGVKCLCGGRKR